MKFDPKLDLVLERVLDVEIDLVWAAWTQPEHLKQWFCPRPWRVVECDIDLRPGGVFRTLMQGPDGTQHDNTGCFLEVVPNRRLTWTDALEGGYRPARVQPFLPFKFTATLILEPHGSGTKYTAIAMHASEELAKQHDEIGFTQGWGIATDQLVEAIKTGAIQLGLQATGYSNGRAELAARDPGSVFNGSIRSTSAPRWWAFVETGGRSSFAARRRTCKVRRARKRRDPAGIGESP
jgi:uncharacterized protein YndB with AHSA1/START domain